MFQYIFFTTQISSVDPLRTDPYKFVEDIFLEHNLIHSIDTLENEYWLNHFRVFSLKGNKLTKVWRFTLLSVYK